MLAREKYKFINSTVILAAIPFIIWDIIAVRAKHWSFNPEYITGIKVFSLPIEELLFFIIVPQASLLIWVALNKYDSLKEFKKALLRHFEKSS